VGGVSSDEDVGEKRREGRLERAGAIAEKKSVLMSGMAKGNPLPLEDGEREEESKGRDERGGILEGERGEEARVAARILAAEGGNNWLLGLLLLLVLVFWVEAGVWEVEEEDMTKARKNCLKDAFSRASLLLSSSRAFCI